MRSWGGRSGGISSERESAAETVQSPESKVQSPRRRPRRRPKSEIRNPKEGRNPKSEFDSGPILAGEISDFDLRPSDFFRPLAALARRRSGSDFGFRVFTFIRNPTHCD